MFVFPDAESVPIKVVLPAERVPVMIVFPDANVPEVEMFPAVICPATPRPPETVKAPVDIVVLTVVAVILVFPDAVRVPDIVVFPAFRVPDALMFPAETCPETPRPPAMVRAPVAVLVLAVVLAKDVFPLVYRVPVMVVLFAASVVRVVEVAESDPVTVFPEVICPATPTPPDTMRAPVDAVVLAVVLVIVAFPEESNAVVI